MISTLLTCPQTEASLRGDSSHWQKSRPLMLSYGRPKGPGSVNVHLHGDLGKGISLPIRPTSHPSILLLFNVVPMVAEFESDLIRARTREGMQATKAKSHPRGKQPTLSTTQRRHLREVHRAGTHSTAELAELFNVARSTVYRTVQRQSVDH